MQSEAISVQSGPNWPRMPYSKVVPDPQAELGQEIAIRGTQGHSVYRKVVPDP